jgi:hypothetical protein
VRRPGAKPSDVSAEKCGWHITARPLLQNGAIHAGRNIEVKGRATGAETVTVTRNEILCALNQANKFLLAIVLVDGDTFERPHYVRKPFEHEPDFGVVSVNYSLADLLSKALAVSVPG